MIKIQNLHKAFGKNTVLNGIDLHIKKGGRITAVLGPNGSGKTTLIKCILGMVIPNTGNIQIQGEAIAGQWQYRKAIDYLPQIAQFPENLTVRELITMIKDIRQAPAQDDKLIQLFGLEDYLDERLINLSGGTKQKVNLTLAFMYDSPLVILDEPTSGLDPVAMVRLRALIREEKQAGKTIMITTHIMSFVEEIADDIVFLLDGKIYFQGPIQALQEQQQETNLERAIASILDQTTSSLPTHALTS
ncbi:MAG: ABC transporter ATP-binding protein [Lewinella sp.]|jgi:Cu-processing system ATP-binding protein|uniref:ABC transporter ATP-binding protein n=1 Tax=Lewinella sp. TaxID=2004506 RepID=UPI003D6AAA7C